MIEAVEGNGARPPRVALRCQGLVKRYGEVTAVNGLDLEVRAGECEILEGLTLPDEGMVEVLGHRWGNGNNRQLRERLGIQLQETKLSEKLTVEETVRLFRSFYQRGHSVETVIDKVELGEKRNARVGKLSGGQKQRLAIACALVSDPDLLFLDEPTTGLDPQARLKVWEIIEQFRDGGGTIILTTHYMEEAARLCDRLVIMDHGRVIALGTPAELVASLGADQIVGLNVAGELREEALRELPGVRGLRAKDGSLSLIGSDSGAALPALLGELERQRVQLVSLTTHQATLEDVFVSMTGRRLRDG